MVVPDDVPEHDGFHHLNLSYFHILGIEDKFVLDDVPDRLQWVEEPHER